MGNDQGAAGYEERARSRKGLERRPQRGAKLGRRKATANLTGHGRVQQQYQAVWKQAAGILH
jgi:hypothetical protein